jgi:hypothetical protein
MPLGARRGDMSSPVNGNATEAEFFEPQLWYENRFKWIHKTCNVNKRSMKKVGVQYKHPHLRQAGNRNALISIALASTCFTRVLVRPY